MTALSRRCQRQSGMRLALCLYAALLTGLSPAGTAAGSGFMDVVCTIAGAVNVPAGQPPRPDDRQMAGHCTGATMAGACVLHNPRRARSRRAAGQMRRRLAFAIRPVWMRRRA